MEFCQENIKEVYNKLFDDALERYNAKQEREKEVAKLEQALSDEKAEISEIVSQQILAEQETKRIKNEGEAIRQELSELSAKNVLLRQETDGLIEGRKKILSDNGELEQQQKKYRGKSIK